MSNDESLNELIDLLKHCRSPKRRSAARRLRKLKNVQAGEALLDALNKEVQDPRTWETQYQMIMALGECGYRDALPYFYELASWDFDATMIYMALGDAIVRLDRKYQEDPKPVLKIMRVRLSLLEMRQVLRLKRSIKNIDRSEACVRRAGNNSLDRSAGFAFFTLSD